MTQMEMILKILQEDGSINPMEALKECSCMRLAARIGDLRRLGYEIRTDTETSTNRFGKRVSFARYSLVPKGQTEFKL